MVVPAAQIHHHCLGPCTTPVLSEWTLQNPLQEMYQSGKPAKYMKAEGAKSDRDMNGDQCVLCLVALNT
jgi:hypothetical protein